LWPAGIATLFYGFNGRINAHFVAVLKTICQGLIGLQTRTDMSSIFFLQYPLSAMNRKNGESGLAGNRLWVFAWHDRWHPIRVRILRTDFVETQSAEEKNNSVINI